MLDVLNDHYIHLNVGTVPKPAVIPVLTTARDPNQRAATLASSLQQPTSLARNSVPDPGLADPGHHGHPAGRVHRRNCGENRPGSAPAQGTQGVELGAGGEGQGGCTSGRQGGRGGQGAHQLQELPGHLARRHQGRVPTA